VEKGAARIVLAGGGTGGHLYPALSVADEIGRRLQAASISFVGSRRGIEQRLVPLAGYPLRSLSLSGLQGAGPIARARAATAAAWAVLRCLGFMVRERPDLVIGVGGFASGPAVLAAVWLRVKTMVLEQNHFPGATNRFLAPRVDALCLPSEEARARIRGRAFVTGTPVRAEFLDIGEPPGGPLLALLVFGGSRGARSINRAVTEALGTLARLDRLPRIVHQTGVGDEEEVREAYARYPADRHEVRAFLDDMPARLAAADLVVCRAGASTIAELCAAGRPSILVPYPFAADDHQRHNAEVLVRAGAARMILDRELTGERLAAQIAELAADRERLREMGRRARALARPDAAARIVDVACGLLGAGAAPAQEARRVP
jgi:UDP-N-acetylglucosamine--N-acetylmuramyl-(pentapeptide) pyrophosphoryl-undecaprenol N-acetylglucosamine transferase